MTKQPTPITLNTPTGVKTFTNYGTGAFMPDPKQVVGTDSASFMSFLKTLDHDKFISTIQSALKGLPSQYTKQGYGKIWSTNPEAAWKDFTNTQDTTRSWNVANSLWRWSPSGQWWSAHAGLGKVPDKDSLFDTLFMTGVTGALGVAGGLAGGALLGPTLGAGIGSGIGAGAMTGFTQGDNPLAGAAKGASIGGIGGAITQGLSGTQSGTWMEGISPETLKTAGYSQAEISALNQAATSGAVVGNNGLISTGNSTIDNTLNKTVIGAAKGGVISGISGGDILTGAVKGGVTSGINSTANSLLEPNNSIINTIVGMGSNLLSGEITNKLIGSSTPANKTTPIQSGTNNMSTPLSNSSISGTTVQDWYNLVNPALAVWTTNKQGNQIDQGYQAGINMITTPSPDQAKFRQQLSKLMQNPGSFASSPVYQFAFGQGQNALERSLNSRGMRGSGNELYEMVNYGQGLAGQQYFKQAELLAGLSGVRDDAKARAIGGEALINQGQAQAGVSGAMSGDISKGVQQLLSGGLTGSGLSTKTLSDLLKTANSWFPSSGNIGLSEGIAGGGNTTDFGSGDWGYGTVTNPWDWWDGNSLSGLPVDFGSEQDMMLNDQWNWEP